MARGRARHKMRPALRDCAAREYRSGRLKQTSLAHALLLLPTLQMQLGSARMQHDLGYPQHLRHATWQRIGSPAKKALCEHLRGCCPRRRLSKAHGSCTTTDLVLLSSQLHSYGWSASSRFGRLSCGFSSRFAVLLRALCVLHGIIRALPSESTNCSSSFRRTSSRTALLRAL